MEEVKERLEVKDRTSRQGRNRALDTSRDLLTLKGRQQRIARMRLGAVGSTEQANLPKLPV